MNANLFQSGGGQYQEMVGGPVKALNQGSVGPVMSDLQNMLATERKQHQEAYGFEHGNNQ